MIEFSIFVRSPTPSQTRINNDAMSNHHTCSGDGCLVCARRRQILDKPWRLDWDQEEEEEEDLQAMKATGFDDDDDDDDDECTPADDGDVEKRRTHSPVFKTASTERTYDKSGKSSKSCKSPPGIVLNIEDGPAVGGKLGTVDSSSSLSSAGTKPKRTPPASSSSLSLEYSPTVTPSTRAASRSFSSLTLASASSSSLATPTKTARRSLNPFFRRVENERKDAKSSSSLSSAGSKPKRAPPVSSSTPAGSQSSRPAGEDEASFGINQGDVSILWEGPQVVTVSSASSSPDAQGCRSSTPAKKRKEKRERSLPATSSSTNSPSQKRCRSEGPAVPAGLVSPRSHPSAAASRAPPSAAASRAPRFAFFDPLVHNVGFRNVSNAIIHAEVACSLFKI